MVRQGNVEGVKEALRGLAPTQTLPLGPTLSPQQTFRSHCCSCLPVCPKLFTPPIKAPSFIYLYHPTPVHVT